MIKKTALASIVILLFALSLKAQPFLDSTYRRLSFTGGTEMAFPGNSSQISKRLTPALGFDLSTGRHLRVGMGLHYFERPCIYTAPDNITFKEKYHVISIQAMELPLNIGITILKLKRKNASLNLIASYVLGHSIMPGDIYKTQEVKIGVALDAGISNGTYLALSPYVFDWFIKKEFISTTPGIGIDLRFGWLYYKPQYRNHYPRHWHPLKLMMW